VPRRGSLRPLREECVSHSASLFKEECLWESECPWGRVCGRKSVSHTLLHSLRTSVPESQSVSATLRSLRDYWYAPQIEKSWLKKEPCCCRSLWQQFFVGLFGNKLRKSYLKSHICMCLISHIHVCRMGHVSSHTDVCVSYHTYTCVSTYPKTVCGPRASAVLLFHTDLMNRVHSSEEAPRSFTMAPCVVVERLEGKQQCSRA